ncbi:hypothetical protein MHBO_002104 [Bonamia ostreae]|uniref:CCAAT-binding factor domain-containing protein n=1 Tax=Bonamia ostreae TaxID=126728 RepID=A0ABV2AL85_9EUKA
MVSETFSSGFMSFGKKDRKSVKVDLSHITKKPKRSLKNGNPDIAKKAISSKQNFIQNEPFPKMPKEEKLKIFEDLNIKTKLKYTPKKQNYNNLDEALKRAKMLYEEEIKIFSTKQSKNLLSLIDKKGAAKDKIYSSISKIIDSPLHQIDLLHQLINRFSTQKPKHSVVIAELLTDLFINNLLPNRKLSNFKNNFSKLATNSDKALLAFHYEDLLKREFCVFTDNCEKILSETNFEWYQVKILTFLFQILKSKSEKEEEILCALTRLIFSNNKTIIAKTLLYFNSLFREHPGMKIEVFKEIEKFLNSKNNKNSFYAVVLISQFRYSKHEIEKKLAIRTIKTLLNLFSKLNFNDEKTFKIASTLFCAINRALPFTDNFDFSEKQLDALYKSTHLPHLPTIIQSLSLLFNIYSKNLQFPDRFYNALYSSMLSTTLENAQNKHTIYLSLIYRSILKDADECRILAFVKRLLQLCALQSDSFSCKALITIFELTKTKKFIKNYLFDNEKNFKECAKSYKYDARNPRHSFANGEQMVEMRFLERHINPIISKMASQIVQNNQINFETEFSNSDFVTKFASNEIESLSENFEFAKKFLEIKKGQFDKNEKIEIEERSESSDFEFESEETESEPNLLSLSE